MRDKVIGWVFQTYERNAGLCTVAYGCDRAKVVKLGYEILRVCEVELADVRIIVRGAIVPADVSAEGHNDLDYIELLPALDQ